MADPAAKDYGFDRPRWQMKLGLEGNQELVIKAGDEDPETKAIYMQVTGEPVVFQLPSYNYQNIDIDDSKFFIDNPLEINPEKIEKLSLHTDTKNLQFNPKEKKWDSLTNYLNDLKTLSVVGLLFESAEQKKSEASNRFWIEIQKFTIIFDKSLYIRHCRHFLIVVIFNGG